MDYKNVLEFRNSSWWNPDVFSALTKHQVSFCGMSHPDFPVEVVKNTPVVYYRFHGIPELYKSKYSPADLNNVGNQILDDNKVGEVFIYFNNDIDGSAFLNAQQLTKHIEKKSL